MKKFNSNYNNHTFVIGFVLLITFTSCEGFLSQTSTNDVADEDMFSDAASLESARIGMYNSLQNQYYYGGFYQLITDAYSDNGATGGYDNLDLDELGNKLATPNNIYLENCWIAMYNTIYTANQILENIDGITDPLLSDDLRNDIKGEALTIRAMAHFDVLRMFGEHWDNAGIYGIPVVTAVLSTEDIVGRSTVAATYDAILSDLLLAETLLSNDDLRFDPPSFKGAQFITKTACHALLARTYQYKNDNTNALIYAQKVITEGFASLIGADELMAIYTNKLSSESIFELVFNGQDKSQFNALTYARPDALRGEISFLAAADLATFYEARPDDLRSSLVDFINNDVSIEPDGRTQKYRGEVFQENSAYIFRFAEILLILAESSSFPDGVTYLNDLRSERGMSPIAVASPEEFKSALMDERRSELNFEGHRYFDLAHFGMVTEVLGDGVLSCLPIPAREVGASSGAILQYPGY